MDDYRHLLKGSHVVPIGNLLDEESTYQDDQIISVAGIVQTIKMKTTRNNSMMAYVTLEDDTAAIEMLAFSNVLSQYGSYLRENQPVVITGRLSMRDDKEPQIVVNRARPMSDFENQPQEPERPVQAQPAITAQTLYLRLVSENDPAYSKVKAIINMFPGSSAAVLYFADTKLRRGAHCALDERMITELRSLLGNENVVVK
jgi:DNA polymerase-3 subunit alpha